MDNFNQAQLFIEMQKEDDKRHSSYVLLDDSWITALGT